MALELDKNIYDNFVLNDIEYVILNDRMSYDDSLNKKLLVGKVQIVDNTKEIIALDEEEYIEAVNYYLRLKLAYQKEQK